MAKRLSIINFKGGVGKTTLAFHLGTGLARYHEKKVLLVDMDHQSSLSILCLGAEGWERAVREERTINKIFQHFVGESSSFPSTEIVFKNAMRKSKDLYCNLDLVPASLRLDDTEIELTASHQGNAIQSEWNKRTLVCKWLEKTKIDEEYDYIIFDCPPATKIVSQNAIAASHGYIIPMVPEAVMERGAPHLFEMVKSGIDARLNALATMGDVRSIHVSETKLIALAITRIQTSGGRSGYTDDHTQHLSSLERHWGGKLAKPYIVQGTGLSQALADGVPVYNRSTTQNVGGRGLCNQFIDLTAELKQRIDQL
jgi:chromosome partitioning protein